MRCSLKKKKKKEESWFLPKTYSVGPQNISRLAFSLPGPEKALNVFFLIIFIEIQQNYNVVLITGLQLSSPIIHTHRHTHTHIHICIHTHTYTHSFLFNFLNYLSMITHLQETWKIQNKVTYSSTIYCNYLSK